jgi:DNA repair protein RecN (Recombination protein N)
VSDTFRPEVRLRPLGRVSDTNAGAPYDAAMLQRLSISNLVLIREAGLGFDPGLNAITGETGAGKTILSNAIGLLLGARGDAALIGAAGEEAYVEAEFDTVDDDSLGPLAELRPEGEDGLVLARRIFPDGRTRAYAWGRAAAREDVAAAAEQLIAMSGQFEQRRLARPAYQRSVLDAFAGLDVREAQGAWRGLQTAQRAHDELTRDADAARARLDELRALVEDTRGLEPAQEDGLRAERERLRHVTELADAASAAAEALTPEEGTGASDLVAAAEGAVAPLERLAPELAAAGDSLRQLGLQLRDTAAELRGFLLTLEAEPGRLEEVESELDRFADLRRRYRAQTFAELLEQAAAARTELGALEGGHDPVQAAEQALEAARAEVARVHAALRAARQAAAEPFAAAVADELRGVGLGEGEFRVELGEREPGATGADDVAFLIRPNAGLPFGPVAETASGGELSRIALAIAAVAGGETMVFDEIDAGIGGTTAHAVAETLRRLAGRAQVITITHLPQIATVADRHFRVEKVAGDPTHTQIEALDDAERRDEIERMLGGAEFLASVSAEPGSLEPGSLFERGS